MKWWPMSEMGHKQTCGQITMSASPPIVLPNSSVFSDRIDPWLSPLCAIEGAAASAISADALSTGYAGQAATATGGGRQRNLARRLRFCAVAVSRTSSLAPLRPRRRSRSSRRMRFI